MTLFPLDQIRNALPDQRWEPVLQEVGESIAGAAWNTNFDTESLYEAFDQARPRLNVLLQIIAEIDGAGADISTGLGFLPAVLARIGRDITATDPEPPAAALIPPDRTVLRYRLGEPLPMAESSLDYLVFAEVLEHLKHPPVWAIGQLVPLLRPGGRFLLTTPNIARRSHIEALAAGENFLEPFPESIPGGADATDFVEHVREYSVREVIDAVEGAGLAVRQALMTDWGEAGYQPAANPYSNGIIVVDAEV